MREHTETEGALAAMSRAAVTARARARRYSEPGRKTKRPQKSPRARARVAIRVEIGFVERRLSGACRSQKKLCGTRRH